MILELKDRRQLQSNVRITITKYLFFFFFGSRRKGHCHNQRPSTPKVPSSSSSSPCSTSCTPSYSNGQRSRLVKTCTKVLNKDRRVETHIKRSEGLLRHLVHFLEYYLSKKNECSRSLPKTMNVELWDWLQTTIFSTWVRRLEVWVARTPDNLWRGTFRVTMDCVIGGGIV